MKERSHEKKERETYSMIREEKNTKGKKGKVLWNDRVRGGQKDRKRNRSIKKDQIEARNLSPAIKTYSWGCPNWERSDSSEARPASSWDYLHRSHWEQYLLCCQSQPGRRTHSRHPQNSPEWGGASGGRGVWKIGKNKKSLLLYWNLNPLMLVI